MGYDVVVQLHNDIKDQFDIMHGLRDEIIRLRDENKLEEAARLAKIYKKLAEKAGEMHKRIADAA